jgi:hypothetical protein
MDYSESALNVDSLRNTQSICKYEVHWSYEKAGKCITFPRAPGAKVMSFNGI